jgi:hypothetical protein
MKKGVLLGGVGCLLFCLSTCDRTGPTIPSNPVNPAQRVAEKMDATATGIAVVSTKAAYFIGDTETFTASLKNQDGSATPVSGGTWRSDTPGVATVSEAGMVTITGQGWANISCSYNGLTGSKQVWGRVDCRGTWSGTYAIQHCQIWGDFPDTKFCETHGGSGFPIELVLAGEGETLRGTITLGDLSTPFVAKPLMDGSLEMEGEIPTEPYVTNVAVGCDWTTSGPSFSMMLYYYRGTRFSGQAMLRCDISLSKTGAGE